LRFTTAVLILILTQAVQRASLEHYSEHVSKADLVVVAAMKDMDLVADGKQTSWTVTYKVHEVLKGEYAGETVTVQLDSESFKKRAKAGGAGRDSDDLLILFLSGGKGQAFSYSGPALNSPHIAATSENIVAVRAEIERQAQLRQPWYYSKTAGAVLIAAFVLVIIGLAFLVRAKRRLGSGEAGTDHL
jgi:hypothetical protein